MAAVARDRDATDHLALAVEFGNSASLIRAELDACHIGKAHRYTGATRQHDVLEILLTAQVALAAHHVFTFAHLDHACTDIAVRGADCPFHRVQIDAEGVQAVRVDADLVLLDEAADAGHLGDARRLRQLKAQVPVLQRTQLSQIVSVAAQRVLIDPTDTARIGTERRCHSGRQAATDGVEVLKHPGSCPVEIGAVVEDHVHERGTEERKAAHHPGVWHREQCTRERVGDLVLDHLRSLAGVVGVDDHLYVGEVRQRIDRCVQQCVEARQSDAGGGHQHQHHVAQRPCDQGVQHGQCPPCP